MTFQTITVGAAERFIERVRQALVETGTGNAVTAQRIDDAFHVAGLRLDAGSVLVIEPKPNEKVHELVARLQEAHKQLAYYFGYNCGTCACGARAGSLTTHPHVSVCETALAINEPTR